MESIHFAIYSHCSLREKQLLFWTLKTFGIFERIKLIKKSEISKLNDILDTFGIVSISQCLEMLDPFDIVMNWDIFVTDLVYL